MAFKFGRIRGERSGHCASPAWLNVVPGFKQWLLFKRPTAFAPVPMPRAWHPWIRKGPSSLFAARRPAARYIHTANRDSRQNMALRITHDLAHDLAHTILQHSATLPNIPLGTSHSNGMSHSTSLSGSYNLYYTAYPSAHTTWHTAHQARHTAYRAWFSSLHKTHKRKAHTVHHTVLGT